jgi:hypothetical protein
MRPAAVRTRTEEGAVRDFGFKMGRWGRASVGGETIMAELRLCGRWCATADGRLASAVVTPYVELGLRVIGGQRWLGFSEYKGRERWEPMAGGGAARRQWRRLSHG